MCIFESESTIKNFKEVISTCNGTLGTKEKNWEENENALVELSSAEGLGKKTSATEGRMKLMQRSSVTLQ